MWAYTLYIHKILKAKTKDFGNVSDVYSNHVNNIVIVVIDVNMVANIGGAATWAGWAMALPKFWVGGPQCIGPHQ